VVSIVRSGPDTPGAIDPIGLGLRGGSVIVEAPMHRSADAGSGWATHNARVVSELESSESSGQTQTIAPGLTVAAVARRLGVAPATLRTWDRRYGLGPSEHRAGSHRRYTAADLARLEHMRRLVLAGIPPGDAARDAIALEVDPSSLAPVTDIVAGVASLDQASAEDDGSQRSVAPGRSGGGQVIPIPGGTPASRGLARAALALDGNSCRRIISEAIERRGVISTWDHLLVPVLAGVGQRWESSGRGIDVEHILSDSVHAALADRARELKDPANARLVMLAASDEETHFLPLWAVAAALAERRIGIQMLGARVPHDTLLQAVRRIGPAAVFVWAQIPGSARITSLADLTALRPAPSVLAGGPGWQGTPPPGVWVATDLTETVARISRSLGM